MNSGNGAPGDEEAGRLVELLRDQEVEPAADFAGKVKRSIHRKAAAGQYASFAWQMPKVVLLEMLSLCAHWADVAGGSKDKQS